MTDNSSTPSASIRDAFRAELADALRPLTDPNEMKLTACRLLVQHLAVGRASYAEVDPDNIHVIIAAEFTHGMLSFAGRHRSDDYGLTVIAALRAGHTVVINDVEEHAELTEAERMAYAAVGMRALVVVPLIKGGGRWISALGVNAASPRSWAADEVDLIEEVAERMWEAVERAKAEASLRENVDRLRLAVRVSNIGLWDWDRKTDVVVFSPEWKALLGYAEDEIRNELNEWKCRVHPDDIGPTLDRIRRAIVAGDMAYEVEFRMRHKDGTWRWIFSRAEVIRDACGSAVRILGCHLDVTTQRQALDAIREREARLTAILSTAGVRHISW